MSDTELAWIGLQDLREDLVEGDLDVGLRKTDISVGIVERREIQFHEFSTVDLSAGRSGQSTGKWAMRDGYMNLGRRSEMYILRASFSSTNMILGNGRLELDEGNDGGSIVEVANEDCGTLDRLVLVDNILDLTQLDTLTTELDLTILSATVDNITIGAVHRNITGPVEALSRDEGVGDERLLGLLRLVEVSTSELNATDEQLSFDTDGGRAQVLIEDVQIGCWGEDDQ
jgi:hypothetical protein